MRLSNQSRVVQVSIVLLLSFGVGVFDNIHVRWRIFFLVCRFCDAHCVWGEVLACRLVYCCRLQLAAPIGQSPFAAIPLGPSASHRPVSFLCLLALSFPFYFPFLSLGRLCQRSPRTFPVPVPRSLPLGGGGGGCMCAVPLLFVPGTTNNYMRTGCIPCGVNHYSADGKSCPMCPKGTYTLREGSTICQQCSNISEV